MKTIYDQGTISRADIARKTKLTRTTVSDLVEEMVSADLVCEVGQGPSIGGKRPTLLAVNKDAHSIICLDLSSKKFIGAILNLRGEILNRITSDALMVGKDALDEVIAMIRKLMHLLEHPLLGIGIGSQGVVDIKNGIIRTAVRLEWKDVPLKKILEESFGVPVFITNDSDVAALAEYAFGKHEEVDSLVMIQVSEGVSAGILLNGRLHFGDGFGAGEIGHVCAVPGGELCRCGHLGCLQTVASSSAMLRAAQEIYHNHADSVLNILTPSPDLLTLKNVCTAHEQGDRYVRDALSTIGSFLGHSVAGIVGMLNVQHIFITGDLACFGEALLVPIRIKMMEDCLSTLSGETTVELSFTNEDIILLGAEALILREKLGVV